MPRYSDVPRLSKGETMYLFGADGPGLLMDKRSPRLEWQAAQSFALFVMFGTLLSLGGLEFSLLCQWSWLLVAVFGAMALTGYWVLQVASAWLIFWCLPMLHGLLWLQLLLIGAYGVWPSTLWHEFGGHSGQRLLIAQLGSVVLLLFPLAAFLTYLWVERTYLFAIFHDFRSQLLTEHRKWNYVWHVFSPVLPLACWSYFLNPCIFTDLPHWPGTLPVLIIVVLCNGPLLYYIHHRTRNYVGMVRWSGIARDAWLIWCKPTTLS